MMKPQLHVTNPNTLELIDVVVPVENRMFVKPLGGFWTSTYDGGTSAWVDWCESEDFGDVERCNWFVLKPKSEARIYEIDAVEDLKYLAVNYPDAQMPAHFNTALTALDFQRIAQEYDAIHLTERGQWATRFSNPGLYGWDCESTLWFRWCFTSVERVK